MKFSQRLRLVVRRVGRWFGLYDECVTEIENRRAVRDSDVERVWLAEIRRRITKS